MANFASRIIISIVDTKLFVNWDFILHFRFIALLVILLLNKPLFAESYDLPAASEGTLKGSINLSIGVLWEGEHLAKRNLEALSSFRRKYKSIPLVQFFNPVHLIRKQDLKLLKKHFEGVILKKDVWGLHLHSWKSLLEHAGVPWKTEPSFWGNILESEDCAQDCGHEIPLTVYDQNELERVISRSFELLKGMGLPKPLVFWAGGWLSTPALWSSLSKFNIYFDFSAVPTRLLEDKLSRYPLYTWLQNRWSYVHPFSQPQGHSVGDSQDSLKIVSVPNNLGTIDYMDNKKLLQLVKAQIHLSAATPDKPIYLSLGMYQDTAAMHLKRLGKLLKSITAMAQTHQVRLGFLGRKELMELYSQFQTQNE